MQRVRIGCSGWSYNDWRGSLYPQGPPQRRWLERYAEVFVYLNNDWEGYALANARYLMGGLSPNGSPGR
jgi:uncharacterized protein YecE (DUF72 family)